MDPLIIGLVVFSAALHVAWNVRLKTAGDPLRAATIGMLAATPVIVPLGVVGWWTEGMPPFPPEGLLLGVTSGVIEAFYFVLLAAAYRRGDLSVIYPIARGTAPLLLVAVGVVLLGERLGTAGTLGVVGLLAGFLLLQQPWRALQGGGGRGMDTAVLFALAVGVTIATYTTIDRLGTRLISPLPYAAILWITTDIVLVLWVARVAGGGLWRDGPSATRHAAIGGWLTLGAYVCVLIALSVAPLSGVAPLRESASVFAAAWGSVKLGEAADRADIGRRIGASILIVGGALLLAAGG